MNLDERPCEAGLRRVELFALEAGCVRYEKFLGESDWLINFIHVVSLRRDTPGK